MRFRHYVGCFVAQQMPSPHSSFPCLLLFAGPSIDDATKVELDEHERSILPVDRSREGDHVVSQVKSEEDHSLELPEQGTSGTCDLVLVPDASVE